MANSPHVIGLDQPPPRLSSLSDHPDFDPIWSRRVAQVYLDGKPVKDVLRFDTRQGWVEILERDDKGREISMSDRRGGRYLGTRTEKGEVTVRFHQPPGFIKG